ncbi:MAG: T9SS type A sorting domain-containing protein [Bacteroidota bacterium]|nr:T9SS type A sorting domain-containing protein [Bacteroidota bacterium]MDP4233998.1 T9SS type A sorting domain-containing protein [Bacteroidota bacterium]MDP4242865.1 T9SS type A sorting domain-containing protein [Bacteroidota bacterium]MDP4287697.1 T9SS type A sorting domain-containing protein [Bacteroidota bacterium]
MKIEEELQHSQELAEHFAKRREEAPLLSTSEVEKLLGSRAMLPTRSRNIIRRSIMTLAGISGIGAIAYFAFSGPPQQHPVHENHVRKDITASVSGQQEPIPIPMITQTAKVASARKAACRHAPMGSLTPKGWSSGDNNYFIQLSPEERARIGLVVSGDTVYNYMLNERDTAECGSFGASFISTGSLVQHLPAGVHAPRFYPLLMTLGNGRGAAWRNKDAVGWMGTQGFEEEFRNWLLKPAEPGYYALGYMKMLGYSDSTGQHYKVTLTIGKNFPKPSLIPFSRPKLQGYSDTVINDLVQLAHYYEGSIPRPDVVLPKSVIVKVDTTTPVLLLHQLDSLHNTASMQNLRSTMSHLDELIGVPIHRSGHAPDSDYVLWYKPTEEFLSLLPSVKAETIRSRTGPPSCLSMPHTATGSVNITYCVEHEGDASIMVMDLWGRSMLSSVERAHPGDNVAAINTETLASGMYLVVISTVEGARSQRIWIENTHPKMVGTTENPLPRGTMPSAAERNAVLLAIPHVELDSSGLARIGIESNQYMAAYHYAKKGPSIVERTAVMRSWGTMEATLDRNDVKHVTPQDFRPTFVTDGAGRKRVYLSMVDTSIKDPKAQYDALMVEETQKFASISELVPILIRELNTPDSVGARDLIFWYQPTPEFLAALPDSARAIAKIMIGQSSNASVQSGQGVIEKVSAYPNPSKGNFTARFTLTTLRTLTLTMRNLLGQQVAPPVVVHAEGTSEQKLDFDSLGEGVYILDVTSDAGEEYLQRVVIVR